MEHDHQTQKTELTWAHNAITRGNTCKNSDIRKFQTPKVKSRTSKTHMAANCERRPVKD